MSLVLFREGKTGLTNQFVEKGAIEFDTDMAYPLTFGDNLQMIVGFVVNVWRNEESEIMGDIYIFPLFRDKVGDMNNYIAGFNGDRSEGVPDVGLFTKTRLLYFCITPMT